MAKPKITKVGGTPLYECEIGGHFVRCSHDGVAIHEADMPGMIHVDFDTFFEVSDAVKQMHQELNKTPEASPMDGDTLRFMRKEILCMTQEELGQVLGYDTSTIKRAEALGKENISTVMALAVRYLANQK